QRQVSMLLTLTTTAAPATDLGYLLAKNPARLHTFDLAFGKAHVFYPEATPERCTAALMLEVDPVGLVRGRQGPAGEGGALEQYGVSHDEVEKLLRHGAGWLERHPEREAIARRYLKHQKSLARAALERLVIEEDPEEAAERPVRVEQEADLERPLSLDEQRRA